MAFERTVEGGNGPHLGHVEREQPLAGQRQQPGVVQAGQDHLFHPGVFGRGGGERQRQGADGPAFNGGVSPLGAGQRFQGGTVRSRHAVAPHGGGGHLSAAQVADDRFQLAGLGVRYPW